MKEKTSVVGSVFRNIGNVLIGILIFVFMFSGVITLSVGTIISEDTIENVVNGVDMYEICNNFVGDNADEDEPSEFKEVLSGYIINGEQYNISKKTAKKLATGKAVKSLFADTITRCIDSLAEENDGTILTKSDVLEVFKDSEDDLAKQVDYTARWDYDAINADLDEIDFDEYSVEEILKDVPEAVKTVVKVLKYMEAIAIGMLVLGVALLALLWVINNKHIKSWLFVGGISTLLAGLGSVALFIFLGSEPEFLMDGIPEGLLATIIEALELPKTISYIMLIVGVLMLGIGILVGVIQKNKRSKRKATPKQEAPQQTMPQQTIPQETIPQQTIPQEVIPQQTIPQEVVPQQVDDVQTEQLNSEMMN